ADVPDAFRITESRYVRLAVAVIIARNDRVAISAEWDLDDRRVAALANVPGAVRRTEYRDIGLAVAVIITRNRNITGRSELDHVIGDAGVRHIPHRFGFTIDRNVVNSVSVIIADHGNVADNTPWTAREREITAPKDPHVVVSRVVRTAIDRKVRLAVSVKIARCEFVGRITEVQAGKAVRRLIDIPRSRARTINRDIRASVTVKIGTGRTRRRAAYRAADIIGEHLNVIDPDTRRIDRDVRRHSPAQRDRLAVRGSRKIHYRVDKAVGVSGPCLTAADRAFKVRTDRRIISAFDKGSACGQDILIFTTRDADLKHHAVKVTFSIIEILEKNLSCW